MDAGDREAALLEDFAVVARPLDLGIDERDHGRVGADAVDEQSLREPELGRSQADSEGVVHDPRHPLDLAAEGVIEAIHRGGAGLQDRVAEPPDERHGGGAPSLDFRVELRALLPLGLDRIELVLLLCHRDRVYCGSTSTAKLAPRCPRSPATAATAARTAAIAGSRSRDLTTSCERWRPWRRKSGAGPRTAMPPAAIRERTASDAS